MGYLKASHVKACNWEVKIGTGLLEDGDGESTLPTFGANIWVTQKREGPNRCGEVILELNANGNDLISNCIETCDNNYDDSYDNINELFNIEVITNHEQTQSNNDQKCPGKSNEQNQSNSIILPTQHEIDAHEKRNQSSLSGLSFDVPKASRKRRSAEMTPIVECFEIKSKARAFDRAILVPKEI